MPRRDDSRVGAKRSTAARESVDARRRVRYTLDLAREQHRFLKLFAVDAEVDASMILRVLLELLENDRHLADRVHKRLGAPSRSAR